MKLDNKLLIGLSLLVGLGFSSSASAQTSDLIQVDPKNHYGQFWIDNVHVVEKEYYKVIVMNIHVKVKDLTLEDNAEINWYGITITNENGKAYHLNGDDVSDCKKGWTGLAYVMPGVSGTEGGNGVQTLCYMVEKEFNNFKVYYTIGYYPLSLQPHQIGSIDLNQNSITNAGSYAKNIVNNADSYAKNLVNNTTSYTKNIPVQAPDFFTQLFDWLKNLFHLS